jgi:hypothetical protein
MEPMARRFLKLGRLAGVLGLVVGLNSLGFDSPGFAAAPEPPAPAKYEVTGFRDVRFGMTEPEVRAAITKAFALKPADLTSTTNPVEGTSVLTAKIASLDPAPGPARVAYIFGYASKKLIQVNVIWGEEPSTPPPDATAMIAAGTRLERYFAGFSWKKDTTRAGVPVGDNTVVLFSGEDEKKGAVRLIADGVKFQVQREGNQTTSPEPKGPPKLIINYIADRETPDIAKIEPGKF